MVCHFCFAHIGEGYFPYPQCLVSREPDESYISGDFIVRSATDAHGVSISNKIGINLSSQDGWSTSAALTYDLATSANVCGVSNFPGDSNPSAGFVKVH